MVAVAVGADGVGAMMRLTADSSQLVAKKLPWLRNDITINLPVIGEMFIC